MSTQLETPLFGLDATSEVSPAAQHAVGSKFVIRYLSRYTSKVVTRAEYEDYQRDGIYLGLVFEDGATNALGGYDQGKSDAEWARKQAVDILGNPPNPKAGVAFAVDFDPAGAASRTDPYFDGVGTVLQKWSCGPYGGKEVVSLQADRGFGTLYQTYAWSGGLFDKRAQWFQYSNGHVVGGVGVDFDKAFDLSRFWNFKEGPPPDPNHYERFSKHTYDIEGRRLQEYNTVLEYDRRRLHPHLPGNGSRLEVLREECRLLAGRLYEAAHAGLDLGEFPMPVNWDYKHRGWRLQGLIHRAQGQLVVTKNVK